MYYDQFTKMSSDITRVITHGVCMHRVNNKWGSINQIFEDSFYVVFTVTFTEEETEKRAEILDEEATRKD